MDILLAGFGGQGILFAGKILANAGMLEGKQVSWLPSYGPEMRGGTANCSVCIADAPVGSPLVTHPDLMIVMNLPSYDKFIGTVSPGGAVVVDRSLVDRTCERTDIRCDAILATALAGEKQMPGLANMIMVGKAVQVQRPVSPEAVERAIKLCVPERKKSLQEANLRAFQMGFHM